MFRYRNASDDRLENLGERLLGDSKRNNVYHNVIYGMEMDDSEN